MSRVDRVHFKLANAKPMARLVVRSKESCLLTAEDRSRSVTVREWSPNLESPSRAELQCRARPDFVKLLFVQRGTEVRSVCLSGDGFSSHQPLLFLCVHLRPKKRFEEWTWSPTKRLRSRELLTKLVRWSLVLLKFCNDCRGFFVWIAQPCL